MKQFKLSGIVVPIITPIDKDENVDEAKLRAQVDYVIDGGVSGILAFGSNGEFYMVEEDEQERVLKIILDQAKGRVPVYMGIGVILWAWMVLFRWKKTKVVVDTPDGPKEY